MSASLSLRAARESDAELLLEWRNEPDAAAASRTGAVDPAEHGEWLRAVLADPDRRLLVAEADGEPAGQVRFDRVLGFRYEISVSVAPALRGDGLGARLIAGGCEWLWDATHASEVEAAVRESNEASRRAFERAGFRLAGEAADEGFARYVLRRPEPFTPERPVDRERRLPFSG